jgi:hypothetical protein
MNNTSNRHLRNIITSFLETKIKEINNKKDWFCFVSEEKVFVGANKITTLIIYKNIYYISINNFIVYDDLGFMIDFTVSDDDSFLNKYLPDALARSKRNLTSQEIESYINSCYDYVVNLLENDALFQKRLYELLHTKLLLEEQFTQYYKRKINAVLCSEENSTLSNSILHHLKSWAFLEEEVSLEVPLFTLTEYTLESSFIMGATDNFGNSIKSIEYFDKRNNENILFTMSKFYELTVSEEKNKWFYEKL